MPGHKWYRAFSDNKKRKLIPFQSLFLPLRFDMGFSRKENTN